MSKHPESLDQYKAVNINSSIGEASPHRLIQMLLEGAINKIVLARAAIGRNDTATKASNISSAHAIIEGLQVSLDAEQGGDIADNLDALYDYSARRLVDANLNNDVVVLDEILELLSNIKSGWDGIKQATSSQPPPSGTRTGGVSIGV